MHYAVSRPRFKILTKFKNLDKFKKNDKISTKFQKKIQSVFLRNVPDLRVF